MTDLDCYRHGCSGTLCKASGKILLECDECDMELKESPVRQLSEDNSTLGELAGTIIDRVE